jgi:hypothetical protein
MSDHPRDDSVAADDINEDKCRRCGISCHVAVPCRDRLVVVPGLHCKFLSQEDDGRFGCTVYADRYAQAPWCHSAAEAAPLGYLADDCPYGTPAGMGKIRLPDAEFDTVWPELLRKLRFWGLPIHVSEAALLAEVVRREGGTWRLEPWPGDAERVRLIRVQVGRA